MVTSEEGRTFGVAWKVERREGVTTLTLLGELDLASVDAVGELVDALIRGEPVLVLDLEQLMFMDSTGIRMLGRAHKNAQHLGHRLYLGRVSRPVRRVLHVAGLVEFFDYVEGAPPEEIFCEVCKASVPMSAARCPECGSAV